jgi:fermentation-respiration switch protein FrsA (DUF1100 family)
LSSSEALGVSAPNPAGLSALHLEYGALWAGGDPRVKCFVSVVGVGNGVRWMRSVRRPDEYHDLLTRAAADRDKRVLTGVSALADRNEVLLPDRQSAELGAAARRDNPVAVTQLPLEFVDDTLGFNPEWIVDRIAPRPVLFITTDDDRLVPPQESEAMFARAGEPKKLVILKGFGHYEVYGGEAFRQVMDETVAWYKTHLPAR